MKTIVTCRAKYARFEGNKFSDELQELLGNF